MAYMRYSIYAVARNKMMIIMTDQRNIPGCEFSTNSVRLATSFGTFCTCHLSRQRQHSKLVMIILSLCTQHSATGKMKLYYTQDLQSIT